MLYLFSGDDIKNRTFSYEKFIKSMPKSMEAFFISRNNFDRTQIESLYSGSGLFFSECVVVFSNVFEREEIKDFILEKIEPMSKSSNTFIFLEGKLNKSTVDLFKKLKAEVSLFEQIKEKKEKFNIFSIANAFEKKDKLNMWICFLGAVEEDVSLEEIVGVLFWKAKDTILKRNFSKYSITQLQNLITNLSYLLPKARREGRNAEAALEQFILETF